MSDPVGREVDQVGVVVLPALDRLLPDVESFLGGLEQRLRVDIPVSLDVSGLVAEARLATDVLEADVGSIHLPVDVDLQLAEAELDAMALDRTTEIKVGRGLLSTLSRVVGSGVGNLGNLGSGLGDLVSSTSTRAGIAGLVATIAAIAVLTPILVTAIQALPAILAAIALPIAAIAIGFEGIKDAFVDSGLAAAFEDMSDSISTVFADGLTPVFALLATLMPTLTTGFAQIAQSVIDMTAAGIEQLTSPEGKQQVADIFQSIADAMAIIAPAIGPLTDSLLTLAVEGAAAFERFAPQIAIFLESFNNMIATMSENGTLARAFDGLSKLLALFGILMLWVVRVSLVTMAVFDRVTDDIGRVIGGLDRMSGAITDALPTVATALDGIADLILDLVKDFPDLLFDAGKTLISSLASSFKDAGDALLPGVLGGVAGIIKDHFPGSPVKEGPLTSWNHGGAGKRLMDQLVSGIDSRNSETRAIARSTAGHADDIERHGAFEDLSGGGQPMFGKTYVRVTGDYKTFVNDLEARKAQTDGVGARLRLVEEVA